MSIYTYLKENVGSLGQRAYISPDIPDKKLNNAIISFNEDIDPNHVIALYDSTILGSGKDGCLFLGEALYIKEAFGKPLTLYYEDIVDITLEETSNQKGKIIQNVYITLSSGEERIKITDKLMNVPFNPLVSLIDGIIMLSKNEVQFKNTNQVTPLEQLDENIKVNYIKVVINFITYNVDKITTKQHLEVNSLVARIGVSKDSRRDIRGYLNTQISRVETDQLLDDLQKKLSEGEYEVVGSSLIKDVLHVFKLDHSIHDWKESDFIEQLIQRFNLNDKKVNLLVDAILHDEDILNNRKTDSEIKKSIMELATKAGSVGVPVAALYFSGSVIGLGATGITSGLATLGMGGVLGLSGMATGIGTIVILGVGTYQGLKKVTGISEVTNSKQRELMLQGIISNTQKSLNFLIEDINEMTNDLVNEIKKTNQNTEKITKLSKMLQLLSEGAHISSINQETSQKEEIITRLPKELNLGRLDELTKQPTYKQLKEIVIARYEEKYNSLQEDDIEGKVPKKTWVLKETLTLLELEELEKIFESIGYHELSSATIASVKQVAKKASKKASKKTSNFFRDR